METKSKKAPWAIYYNDDTFVAKDGKLMGRHAAGSAYLRAIAQENYSDVAAVVRNNHERDNFIKLFKSFLKEDQKVDLSLFPWSLPQKSEDFGGIFIGDPQVGNYSVLRSNFGHHLYSIVGITHTTMSRSIMDFIGDLVIKPTQEWDALICTSKSVKATVETLLSDYKSSFSERFGVNKFITPELPIIPLGVHVEDFEFDDKEKLELRRSLGIKPDDIAFVFVGRLSFHSKAHHFPMYKALQAIAEEVGDKRKIHLVQVGWFANDYIENIMKNDANLICPNVSCHFVDGLDQLNKNLTLASCDIFISLTDNFQETFGLTPLEAMASGLPVIVTDWNGYRDTVRNNEDGFTIPTISLEKGAGRDLSYNYHSLITNYDQYIAYSSQRVSVDIGICINKIRELINNPSLRKKMGDNGKKQAKEKFAWKNVMKSYSDLRDHLNEKRRAINSNKKLSNYIDFYDPLHLFESYPTETLSSNHIVSCKKNKLLEKDDYLFTSQSINISQDINNLDVKGLNLKVDIENVNSIIQVLMNKKLEIGEIHTLLDLSKSTINKTIIMMLKFDIISIERKD